MNKKNFLSSFWIKIIAIITMTIDHIGVALGEYAIISPTGDFYQMFRIIGRLAFPLFAFGIVQGVIHTRNKLNYMLRLGVSMALMFLGLFIVDRFTEFSLWAGNIFVDLFFGGLIVVLLTLPKYKKLYALIPIAIVPLLLLDEVPLYFQPQYHVYGVAMIILFYLAHLLASYIINHYGLSKEDNISMNVENLLSFGSLVFVNCLFYVIGLYSDYLDYALNLSTQMYSIIAGAFLLFYSGKRGYNSTWFKYGCYLYYPLHAIIIFGLAYLLT